jgi:exoribonuclease R
MTHLVGVLELASKYRYGLTSHGVPLYLFRPYGDRMAECIVGSRHRDLSVNQIAIVELPAAAAANPPPPPGKLRANLVRLIGPVGDYDAEVTGLLYHYCPAHRAIGTTLSAAEMPPPNTDRDAARMEISKAAGWEVFHVDPAGCRDIDDAVAFHPDTGRWAITIADVAAAVPIGSAVDTLAHAIGATFYDAEGRVVLPMLSPHLSENAASLLPGERRRGVSLVWKPTTAEELTGLAGLDDPVFVSSWITVEHSFTYEAFAASRFAHETLGVSCEGVISAKEWIAALMIRYNAAAARVLKNAGRGGVLRVQPPATTEKVAAWPRALQHLAAEAAVYVGANEEEAATGHTGLGLAAYTHASSPLRRYADLINQRALMSRKEADHLPDRQGQADDTKEIEPANTEHLNALAKANKRWSRDMTFLTHVTPGRVFHVDVVFVTAEKVWVPAWQRLLRLRHTPAVAAEPGTAGQIAVYCDPTRRNWKQRVLTADSSHAAGPQLPIEPLHLSVRSPDARQLPLPFSASTSPSGGAGHP